MAEEYKAKITLFIAAGEAAVVPPVGPVLGQYGVNTVQFCEEFNELTSGAAQFFSDSIPDEFGGFVLVVDVYVNYDRTYSYVVRKPTTSFLLRVLSNLPVGKPSKLSAELKLEELVYLAQFKFPNLLLENACFILSGTARSLGIEIIK